MIAGFNGFDVWRYTSPTITTVVSPAYEMGRQAGELLNSTAEDRVVLQAQRRIAGPSASRRVGPAENLRLSDLDENLAAFGPHGIRS